MINLVAAIFSLLLVSALLAAGLQYLPADLKIRVKALEQLEENIEALERGAERYMESIRDPATGAIDLGGARSDLMNDLAPDFMFKPRAPGTGNWIAGVGEHQGRDLIWFCLVPPVEGYAQGVKQAISDLVARKLPEGSAFLADSCGATVDGGTGARLTYWIDGGKRHPGSDIQLISEPDLDTPILYDATRAVRIRVGVSGYAIADAGYGTSSAQVFLDVRQPGNGWSTVDTWEIALSHANSANDGTVRIDQTGAVEAAIPAGWEARFRIDATGDADATLLGGQIQRFW